MSALIYDDLLLGEKLWAGFYRSYLQKLMAEGVVSEPFLPLGDQVQKA